MTAKLRKKALLPAIAMVIASVIALSGVSYAWFTLGDEATLGNVDLKVVAASGIQISMDAATWRSNLTTAEITGGTYGDYTTHKNQFPTEGIYPVSSVGTVTDGLQEMFKGEIDKNGKLFATKLSDDKGATGDYIAFDVFFKVSSEKKIYLDAGSKVTYKEGTTDMSTQYASRVSFINLGSASTATAARALAGTGVTKADYIWEPNAKLHASSAKDNGLAEDGVAKQSYYGVKAAIPAESAQDLTSTNTAYFDVVTPGQPEQSTSGENAGAVMNGTTNIFTLKEGINKVRIYIWLEGQDVDCNNDISSGTIATLLKFKQEVDPAN